jgi:transposase
MLQMDDYAQIREAYYHKHQSIRQIAKQFDLSRQSVRKALAHSQPPGYRFKKQRAAPVLDPFKARITELFDQNQRLPHKQRYTARRIYQVICNEGFTGSESTVRGFVRQLRQARRIPLTYLPLEFDPGMDAQVDWGQAQVILDGKPQQVHIFVMRLCASRRTFVMAFPAEKQECFFAGHIAAFHHFNGVTQRIWYDNLKTASQETLRGRTVKEQKAFLAFRSHYLFQSIFCNQGQGHEKGQVEHAVGFSRRNFMVPLPEAATFEDLNAMLLARCLEDDQRTVKGQDQPIQAAWEAEQPLLRACPDTDVPCCVTIQAPLTPYSQVIYDTNRYSVPTDRAAATLTVQAYPLRVDVLHEHEVIARHPRCYDRNQDIFDPVHYLPLLERRPRGLDHAKPIRQWRNEWPKSYDRLLARLQREAPEGDGVREFVRILRLHETFSAVLIEQAIEQALAFGCAHLDGVRLCLHHLMEPETALPSLDLTMRPKLAAVGTDPAPVACYDELLEGAA